MPRKKKSVAKKQYIKLAKDKATTTIRYPWFTLPSILPQLLIIAVCVGVYYAMIYCYLFFEWGFYIYYAIKLIIAFEILSASVRSLLLPLGALLLGLAVLFTNCAYLNTLMNTDTAWELSAVALAGMLIAGFITIRRSH